jgi:hypothetical protein
VLAAQAARLFDEVGLLREAVTSDFLAASSSSLMRSLIVIFVSIV